MKFLVDILKFAVQVLPLVDDLVKSNKERRARKKEREARKQKELEKLSLQDKVEEPKVEQPNTN